MTELPAIPSAADERATLCAFLDHYRAVVRRKAEGLSDDQLREPLPGHPSSLTVGGILKHLGSVEVGWSRAFFLGLPEREVGEPWATAWTTQEDWEWDAADDRGADLLAWFDEAVRLARETYAAVPLDALSARTDDDGEHRSVRWILVHLVEEHARHAGHLDLLRERLDGTTGD